ncbi:pre-peptidase C-terminal domain-containing protein [Micromonospora rhizosphaerae]|uniref:Pre-peptidase C-terminal domain-containing protein n=1 Tax=Micromonospora rhizosphaerae TaxID=568872 RepID=A0A1C6RPN9_9ACTN|nr:S8 family serine peptidase [Micromonospora rhizosphaerae]SCL19168.1 pre-peptidase C-terminal domain-containing protein [Micromonospora rhizosphaerae]
MSKPPSRSLRASAVLLTSALTATGAFWFATGGTATANAQPVSDAQRLKTTPADTLGSHDMELLAKAKAAGETNVTLIVATEKGQAHAVAASLKKLGGKVVKQFDEVGYVRVSVPTSAVVKAAKLPGIIAVDLNETLTIPDPRPQSAAGADATATVAGPGADTPAANAYMPTNETGAVAFKEAHPEWDGRGVTIGIMDTGIDLDHPALQKTTTGERKIVDWVTATDPIYDGDGSWRAMLTKVSGPTFSYANGTWTAPKGSWLVNRFSESTTDGGNPPEVAGDVNRDGDKTDVFGILYDPNSHDIRVDANQNRDFTDDPVMRPYGEKFQVGHFGKDNPDTGVREQMAFVVEYREDVDLSPYGGAYVGQKADFVNIGIVAGAHGSHVAGITAANDLLGNSNFDGAAPGAKLVSSRACAFNGGCTAAALTDGMVDLVVNRKVDVINMSIGGLPALNDANNARARLYDRLINDYGVQMFISAGNSGPGLNTVGDPSVATDVVSVAASVSKETWLANYGSEVSKANNLFNFSSRGPREDGGLKPSISAPGSAISSIPMWQAGSPAAEAGYSLPAGYGMFNGTSMAAPQATGAAALLLSAAKAKDVGITPAALRRAIHTSAKPIEGVPTYGQGYGMFDVPGAWKLLDQDVKTRDYTSVAPVCTELSGYLATADRGTGLYNRCGADKGGQKVGESKTYTVQLTRKSGPATAITHAITLRGNDGTFSAPAQVVLPLNKTVSVEVTAKPTSAGAHGAIMTIDDPATSVIDFEVSTVIVASSTVEKPDYAFSTEGSVQRNSFTSYFVNVPAGASALQVNLSGVAAGSQTRFIAFNPYGVPVESTSSLGCFTNFSNPATCKPEERDYQNPMPGVWEIEVESRRTSPLLDNPFQLTARVQGVKVEPAVVELPSVTAGQATPVTWTVTNEFGPVTVSGKGGPLGSAAVKRPTIANHEVLTYEVTVPEGATRLDVAIGKTSDLGADLDLYVRRGTTEVGRSADGDSEEAVSLANPAAGVYTIEIDGYSVPAGTTEFDYRDVFYSASLGSVSAPSTTLTLANGGTGTITGSVTADAAPAAGRQLFGELLVVTDEGATVGRGNVSVGAVN